MGITEEQRGKLAEPLDREKIKTRQGPSGRSLSYLPAFEVIERANDIFGYAQWSYKLLSLELIGEEDIDRPKEEWVDGPNGRVKRPVNPPQREEGWRCAYRATCRAEVGGAVYEDVGYGDDVSYDSVLTIHENAMKEAVSDALKRCLRNLGDQFGLKLWDKDSEENVEATSRGRRGNTRHRGGDREKPAQAAPRPLSDTVRKRVLAICTKADVDDDLRHRVTRCLTEGRTSSLTECTAQDATNLVKGFTEFVAVTPREDAVAQLEKWETEHPAPEPVAESTPEEVPA